MSNRNRDLDDAEAAADQREKDLTAFHAGACDELAAMQAAFEALYELPRDSRGRALKWLEARLDNAHFYGEPPF
jgi:hypothetical protein